MEIVDGLVKIFDKQVVFQARLSAFSIAKLQCDKTSLQKYLALDSIYPRKLDKSALLEPRSSLHYAGVCLRTEDR